MTPITYIRKVVFEVSQTKFAKIADSNQSTVSRWETGEHVPDLRQMAKIRAAAIKARKPWDDRWFFEVPKPRPEAVV